MGDKKFGNKAKKIFKSESKLGGISDFLSDSDNNGNTEMQNSEITNNRKYGNTEIRNNDTTENLEGGTSPAMVRHELHLSEELSEKIRKFQFFNKENNKTRLIRIMIEDFFSKSEEQQKKIWDKWRKQIFKEGT